MDWFFLEFSGEKESVVVGGSVDPSWQNILYLNFCPFYMKFCTYSVLTIRNKSWSKNWQMSLLPSFDDVIIKVMCWSFLRYLGIDVFIFVNWVCKMHRKQVAENISKILIIVLLYNKIFQKINHFDHCIKIYRIFNFVRITFVKKWW